MNATGKFGSWVFILGILLMESVAFGQQTLDVRLMDTRAGRKLFLLDAGVVQGNASMLIPSYRESTSVSTLHFLPFIGRDLTLYTFADPRVFTEPMDLTSPLRLERESERKISPFTEVLSVMSAGAVGYVAYQHIRRFGFLK